MSNQGVDDEPDYMSDDFLAKCIPEDIRPGFKRVSSFVTVIGASELVWVQHNKISSSIRLKIHVLKLRFRHIKVNVNMICERKRTNKLNKIGLPKG